MSTLQELLAQREQLEAQISQARESELASALGTVRDLVQRYGLSERDVFPATRGRPPRIPGTVNKVEAKYQDPASGKTWTGRGKPPKWIAGVQDRSPFLIG